MSEIPDHLYPERVKLKKSQKKRARKAIRLAVDIFEEMHGIVYPLQGQCGDSHDKSFYMDRNIVTKSGRYHSSAFCTGWANSEAGSVECIGGIIKAMILIDILASRDSVLPDADMIRTILSGELEAAK